MSNGTLPTSFPTVEIKPIALLGEAKDLLGDQYWLFVAMIFVGVLIGSAVPFGIIMGPMLCGIYLCYKKKTSGEEVKFETLFKGFDYFIESLLVMLILFGVTMVLLIPFYLIFFVGGFAMVGAMGGGGGGNDELIGVLFVGISIIGYLIIFAFMLGVGSLTAFALPLVMDKQMKAVDALKTSIAAARANLMGMLILFFVLGGLGIVASMLCYFPAFLLAPLSFGAIWIVYRKLFPASEVPTPEPAQAAAAAG